jgi:hypothetical protein
MSTRSYSAFAAKLCKLALRKSEVLGASPGGRGNEQTLLENESSSAVLLQFGRGPGTAF